MVDALAVVDVTVVDPVLVLVDGVGSLLAKYNRMRYMALLIINQYCLTYDL